ncbi:MAG: hypothetical protein LBO78_01445 [Rickettsiales bacterium]|nr:hypothetical protein [Rickettsiales bacterium]
MRKKLFRYRHDAGVGMMEVILALGVMMLVVPVVYRLGFKEVAEVRHLSISKQMKQIHKAVMNYVSVEKQGWTNGSDGTLAADVRTTLASNYGLDNSVMTDVTDGMKLRYFKNADGAVEAFAILNLDKAGFDSDLSFKQTLLYVGDVAGYVEANDVYSITGAWWKPLSSIIPGVEGAYTAVLKVDDNDLEAEYSSSFYLYRNSQGGTDGNKMEVNFKMSGYDVKNFGTVTAASAPTTTTGAGKIAELYFNNATGIAGGATITGGIILKGKVRFGPDGKIITPYLNLGGESSILRFMAAGAELLKTASSLRAKIEVAGNSKFEALSVQNMELTNTSSSGDLTIEGLSGTYATERLRVEATNAVAADELRTNVITVKNGRFSAGGVSTSGGNLNLSDGGAVTVYNVGESIPAGLNLDGVTLRFDSRISSLRADIESMH